MNRLFHPLRLFLLFAIAGFILSACSGGAMEEAPAEPEVTALPATPTATFGAPTESATQVPPQPAIPETRRLTLEFPPQIKAGVESEIVRLTLEVDDLGNITPTAELDGNVVEGEVITIPNLYDTHNVTAEARFDMAGMLIQPPGTTFQPLNRGQSVTFYWSIRPEETGRYRGTVWLFLNFVERQTGEESRMAVSAQVVEIEAVDFFGFSVDIVRTSGVVGSVLGVVLGLPFFDDVLKYLWNRRKKQPKRAKK